MGGGWGGRGVREAGGGEGAEGRGQEPGVKPGSLAVYPNDFLFRAETPMRQDQTPLFGVCVRLCVCECVLVHKCG